MLSQADSGPPDPFREPSYATVTPRVLAELEKAGPWMTFVAVLGIIVSGLNFVAGSFILVYYRSAIFNAPDGSIISKIGFLYLVFGLFFWMLFSKLKNSAAAIKKVRTEGSEALFRVVDFQGKFWRLVGLSILGMIPLTAVIIVLIY